MADSGVKKVNLVQIIFTGNYSCYDVCSQGLHALQALRKQ